MSRLDDLIDLIQTTNEVYFITAPGRVRTAFILVDDIIELALKTFLQEKALEQRMQFAITLQQVGLISNRPDRNALNEYFEADITLAQLAQRLALGSPGVAQLQSHISALTPVDMLQHWSANQPDNFRNFHQVVDEVKQFFALGHSAIALLDEAKERHRTRNMFYHDHRQSGLTIDDDKCLRALCGMFDLMEQLFPNWLTSVQNNYTVRCQIGVLRLKRSAFTGQQEVVEPYDDALEQLRRSHRYDIERRSVEHSLVHTVSDRFFRALREQFENKIAELRLRTNQIDNMAHPRRKHLDERADKHRLLDILERQLLEINALLGMP